MSWYSDGDDPSCSDCGCCHCPGACDGEHDCFKDKCECTEQCACCHRVPKEDEWGRKWFTRTPPLCIFCRGEYERDRDEAWAEDMWRRDEEAAGRRPR